MNHNPRKFEEKIALNNQKQAEQNKQFEDIIREVNTIRDHETNFNQFRSLPNIHGGPAPSMYPYVHDFQNHGFGMPVNHHENMWNADHVHHGLNLQLPESPQGRRVLSDSQLHKSGLREDGLNNHPLQRPKSASELLSYENSISAKTGSLPDLSQNYIPVQDESYNQNILHQHYQDTRPDSRPIQFHMSQHQGPYFMSIDEATATDLQHRARQYSPTPSPPTTPQHMYNYTFGSPNQSFHRMTAQMQDVHLHNAGSSNQVLHSGNASPSHHSGQGSPEVGEVKPYIDDQPVTSQHQQQYMQYYSGQHRPPNEYNNIPKIQVITPEEAVSPQYYPADDEMSPGNEYLTDYDTTVNMDSNFDSDQDNGMFSGQSFQNYPYT